MCAFVCLFVGLACWCLFDLWFACVCVKYSVSFSVLLSTALILCISYLLFSDSLYAQLNHCLIQFCFHFVLLISFSFCYRFAYNVFELPFVSILFDELYLFEIYAFDILHIKMFYSSGALCTGDEKLL